MKKLLLTLLMLFTLGLAAQAATEELTLSSSTIDKTTGKGTFCNGNITLTFDTSNASFSQSNHIRVYGGKTFIIAGAEGVTISEIVIESTTTSYYKKLSANVGTMDNATKTWTGSSNIVELTNTESAQARLTKLTVTYEAIAAEKIELEDANLEVKAGEETIESEKELDANTTISWNYNYTGEVANPDITYSYSVDGGEEVEGNEYTYTGEKNVELTVKATSTNTISKTVKLLKKYPTVCPEPVFNVEDGAKVYAGQAVTVSCEGADIEWTVNDVTITGTSYTITEEVGTQLTFYAHASIEGRNPSTGNIETLTAEKEITVTVDEATEALFNFEAGNTYGLTSCSGTDYEKDKGNLTAISNGIVTLSFTEGSNYRFWGNDNTLRIYKGCTLTASVPEGYYITNITMTGKDLTQINYSDEFVNTDITVSNKDYEHVTQTGSANIKTLTVKYAKVPDPELDGEPTINVTHASKKGVLIVEYSFKIANHNGKPVEVTATIDGKEHIAFVDATPANAPARVAGESTAVSGTLRAEHADLVDASNLNVNLKATLGGKEFFTRQATVTNTTGIEDVTVEGEGEAEYFNLQGLRVAQPEAGQLYIKRQAGKAVKVRF